MAYPINTATSVHLNAATDDPSQARVELVSLIDSFNDLLKTAGNEADCRQYASLTAAVAALGSTQVTLVVSDAQTVSANLAIPSTLTLKIVRGGTISIASGYTLTINGPFVAATHQVFSGDGSVSFGRSSVHGAFCEWFGGKADDTVDSYAAINKAITSLSAWGGTVLLTAGVYRLSSEIHLQSHVNLVGQPGATILKPTAAFTSGIMLRNHNLDATVYTGDHDFTVEGLTVDADSKGCGGFGIAHTTGVTIRNCQIFNCTATPHPIDAPANYRLAIIDCYIYNSTPTAIQIDQAAAGSMPTLTTPNLNEDNTVSYNITIKGNTIKTIGNGAIHLHKKGHVEILISENTIIDALYGVVDDSGYDVGHAYLTITNNTIDLRGTASSGHGIVLYSGVGNCLISGNMIRPNATYGNGILLLDDSTRAHSYVTITNNQINTPGASGIFIEYTSRLICEGNTVNYPGDGVTDRYGIYCDNCNGRINDNIIVGAANTKRHGIWIANSTAMGVDGNHLTTLETGIVIKAAGVVLPERSTVTDNIITNTSSYGILILGTDASNRATRIGISGNALKTVAVGIRVQYAKYVTICNNVVQDTLTNSTAISCNTVDEGTISCNMLSGNAKTTSSAGVGINIASYFAITGNRCYDFENGITTLTTSDYNCVTGNVCTGNTNAIVLAGTHNVNANNVTA